MIYKFAVKGCEKVFEVDANSMDHAKHLFMQDNVIVNKEVILLKVRQLPEDDWGRKRVQCILSGKIYADVDGVWHTTSKDGEPDCPIKNKVDIVEGVEE